MKGIVAVALKATVMENFGNEVWYSILVKSGLKKTAQFTTSTDVSDEFIGRLMHATLAELNITMPQAGDAFGSRWMNHTVPRVYPVFLHNLSSSRQLLVKLNDIHARVTKMIPNAQPPHFDYSWEDDNTLIMSYTSHRGLIDLAVGMIKGVGEYFNEELSVRKLNNTEIKVIFPSEKETT